MKKWNDPEITKAVRDALKEMSLVKFGSKKFKLLDKQISYVLEKQWEEE